MSAQFLPLLTYILTLWFAELYEKYDQNGYFWILLQKNYTTMFVSTWIHWNLPHLISIIPCLLYICKFRIFHLICILMRMCIIMENNTKSGRFSLIYGGIHIIMYINFSIHSGVSTLMMYHNAIMILTLPICYMQMNIYKLILHYFL